MTKYIYFFSLFTCFLAGYFVYSLVHKPEKEVVTETKVTVVRDTIIPPPITKWLKGEAAYDTVSVIDTITLSVSLDTLDTRTFTDTLVRGLDSVSILVKVYPGMDFRARIKGQFNPDHFVTKETIKTVTEHNLFEWGVGVTAGLDLKGRPNAAAGITLKIHLDKLNPWRR